MLHAAALGGRLRLVVTANLEKYTIPHGELAPGNWGESSRTAATRTRWCTS